MKKKLSLFLIGTVLTLTSCQGQTLSPNQVSKKFWRDNITEGGLFLNGFNFTLDVVMSNSNGRSVSYTIKNDNGIASLTNPDGTYYYEVTKNGGCAYYYYDIEESSYIKNPNYGVGSYLYDMLMSSIQYNFEYGELTYDEEKLAYVATNFKNESIDTDYVEFQFLNNNVVYFYATKDGDTIRIDSSDIGSTSVTLPSAKEIDYSSPYGNKKYRFDNISVSNSVYNEELHSYLDDAELRILGEDSHNIQLINEVSINEVYITYLTSEYFYQTKTLKLEFGKVNTIGKYAQEGYENQRLVLVDGSITNDKMTLNYQVKSNKDLNETVTCDLVFIEDCYDDYRAPQAGLIMINKLKNKKITLSNIESTNPDYVAPISDFENAYFVIAELEGHYYSELYMNDGTILLGFVDFALDDDGWFSIAYRGILNGDNLDYNYCGLTGNIDSYGIIHVEGSYYSRGYTGIATLTDVAVESLSHGDMILNYTFVSKDTWDDLFNNQGKIGTIVKVVHGATYTSEASLESYTLAIDENRLELEMNKPDGSGGVTTTTKYYEIISDDYINEYIYRSWEGRWIKSRSQMTYASFVELFGFEKTYAFEAASWKDGSYAITSDSSYREVNYMFEFNHLLRQYRYFNEDKTREYQYEFEQRSIELPYVEKRA